MKDLPQKNNPTLSRHVLGRLVQQCCAGYIFTRERRERVVRKLFAEFPRVLVKFELE